MGKFLLQILARGDNLRFVPYWPGLLLALVICIATPLVAAASPVPPTPPPHDVTRMDDEDPLAPHLTYLRDPTGSLTYADVTSPALADRFVTATTIPNLGLTTDAVWVRMALQNPGATPQNVVLTLDSPTASFVDFYASGARPEDSATVATGARRPYASRAILQSGFVFPLQVAPGSTETYWLRVASELPIRLPVTLWRPDAYAATALQSEIWWGVILGMLLLMSAYNLLVFLVIRDSKHLMLAVMGLLVALSSALNGGYASRWLGPDLADRFPQLEVLAVALVMAAFIGLAIVFLELKARLRPAYWFFCGVLIAVAGAGCLSLAGYNRLAFAITITLLLPVLITMFVATVVVLRQGSRLAIYFLIGQTIPILFGIFQVFSVLGYSRLIPALPFAVPLNNLLLLLLMSLALADRINMLRAEAERANIALTASEGRLAQYLDALPFSVVVHDADLTPIYVNQIIRQNGLTNDEAFYREKYDVWLAEQPVYVSGTDQLYPRASLPILRAANGERAHADDLALAFGGQQIALEAWSVPQFNAKGEITSILSAFHDISKRRAIENELAGYREHLEQRVTQRTAELEAANTDLSARVAELSAINAISQQVVRITELEPMLHAVASIVVDLFQVDNATIGLFDSPRSKLQLVTSWNRDPAGLARFSGASFAYRAWPAPPMRLREPVVITDLSALTVLPDTVVADLAARGVSQMLLAPLVARDEVIGGIALMCRDATRDYSANELRVAQTIAGQVAAAIDTVRLIDEERRQRQTADALRQTTATLSRSLDQQTVLGAILLQLRQVLDFEGAVIALVDGMQLNIVDAEGLARHFKGRSLTLEPGSLGQKLLSSRQPMRVADTLDDPEWQAGSDTQVIRSWVGAPLVLGDRAIGIVALVSTMPNCFVPAQAGLLMTFAEQAAVAVDNARLHQGAQLSAAASERERIARDLHDAVTQAIYSASLIAETLPMRGWDMPADLQASLVMLQKLTKGALAEMRTLLLELRPEHLAAAQFEVLLAHLGDAFTGRMGTPVLIQTNRDPGYSLPYDVKVAFYRVAQEALNNVAKHADATQVTINLSIRPGAVRMSVVDDGNGFNAQATAPDRLGFSIMQARAREIGALLRIDSEPKLGTQLFLTWNDGDMQP